MTYGTDVLVLIHFLLPLHVTPCCKIPNLIRCHTTSIPQTSPGKTLTPNNAIDNSRISSGRLCWDPFPAFPKHLKQADGGGGGLGCIKFPVRQTTADFCFIRMEGAEGHGRW